MKNKALLAALEIELAAVVRTKDAANDAMNSEAFYAAVERQTSLEIQISDIQRPKAKGCGITRALVAANID